MFSTLVDVSACVTCHTVRHRLLIHIIPRHSHFFFQNNGRDANICPLIHERLLVLHGCAANAAKDAHATRRDGRRRGGAAARQNDAATQHTTGADAVQQRAVGLKAVVRRRVEVEEKFEPRLRDGQRRILNVPQRVAVNRVLRHFYWLAKKKKKQQQQKQRAGRAVYHWSFSCPAQASLSVQEFWNRSLRVATAMSPNVRVCASFFLCV